MYSMKELLLLSQYQAYCRVKQVINKFPKESVRYKDGKYLIMNNGTVEKPLPMLCIHLDTINTTALDSAMKSEYIVFDKETQTYSLNYQGKLAMRCLGGDDRAGLWIVLHILADKELSKNYSYGIFFDEEVGGKGSTAYTRDYPNYEEGVKCFIGLDRRGSYECATYGSDNQDLIDAVCSYGFKEASGTFTDASNLAFGVACVNLSVGYNTEHRVDETIDMTATKSTLEVLQTLHLQLTQPTYPITKTSRYSNYYYDREDYSPSANYVMAYDKMPVLCDCCGEHAPLYESDSNYLLCADCMDFGDYYVR